MKNQTFGIEIEFTGITRELAAMLVAMELGTSEIEYTGERPYYTRKIKALDGRIWKIERDGSIDPTDYNDEKRCELVSPICKYEDIELIQNIVRKLRTSGAKVNSSCGIHVHVGADGHTARSLINITHIMKNIEPLLFKAFNVLPERTERWCKPVEASLLSKLDYRKTTSIDQIRSIWYDGWDGAERHYHESRYHALNLHSIWQKATADHLGTVEFRLFNSTLHAGEVKTYIQLALAVSNMSKTVKRVKIGVRAGCDISDDNLLGRWITLLGLNGDEFKTARHHMRKGMKAAKAA